MKTNFELSVTISEEEKEILEKAESILEEICFAFEEHNQCGLCPLNPACTQRLQDNSTPHSLLYHIHSALKVEKE